MLKHAGPLGCGSGLVILKTDAHANCCFDWWAAQCISNICCFMASPSTPIMEASRRVHQPRFSSDDINITSSTTGDNPENHSFIYNPSFASSDTSIASYKTERTVNSRKSRYNALPRHKYAGIGTLRRPQGPLSLDVDVPKVCRSIGRWDRYNYKSFNFQTELRANSFSSHLQTLSLPIRNIHIPSLGKESRPTTTRLDSFHTLSPPSLHTAPEKVEVEDGDMVSYDDETDREEAFSVDSYFLKRTA
jgi:hypothetical protein